MYSLIRPLLFRLGPEAAHHTTLSLLTKVHALGLTKLIRRPVGTPVTVMGISFPNPVGLAAGLDKNGEYIDALAALGFGFIEIGTVTPRPQPGNPQPRMFRLSQARAIINRLGFNNKGVDVLLANVQRARYKGVLGINIGKNFDTPIERAADDYVSCLRKVYAHASYVTVNISSPNTQNLRQLQHSDELENLLAVLKNEQSVLARMHGRYVPLAIKISPDLDTGEVTMIAQALLRHKIDGVIATNTTISRDVVKGLPYSTEGGGLSGAPVREKSTAVIRQLAKSLAEAIPIIGVGGILTGTDAVEKIRAGASLVQIYSGMIYRGPVLLGECINALKA